MWVGPLYFPDPEATIQGIIFVSAVLGIFALVTRKERK